MSFQSQNGVTNQAKHAPTSDSGRHPFQPKWRTRTGSDDKLAICPNTVMVPNPKQANV